MIIDDAARVRVILAILGWESRELAAKIGVTPSTMSNWVKGRSTPQREKRAALAQLCQMRGICFLPSGMPVPQSDLLPTQETGHCILRYSGDPNRRADAVAFANAPYDLSALCCR